MNLLDKLITALGSEEKFVSEGHLLKNKVIESALSLDSNLIRLLLSDESIKKAFFVDVDGILVFDKVKFQKFVSNKQFLPDSYTSFSNKIGLTKESEFISSNKSVALSWAYKDCVLEGGQDKDDAKRNEVFWNETLAPDQIDRLLSPKVLTKFKRFEKDGEITPKEITDEDNLIIKGNNLLVLHTLNKKYHQKVKLIYIDPPYNTGSDSFGYNDSFNHSTWLTFMKNRLEAAKELLRKDGAIFVQVDDNEQGYLKVLLDEIFDRENFVNTISVKTKVAGVSGSHHGKSLANTVEYIHLYARDKNQFSFEQTLQSKMDLKEFIDEYEASGKSWKYTSVITELDEGEYVCSIEDGGGDEIKIYKHNKFKTASIQSLAKDEFNGDRYEAYKKYIDRVFRTTNAQSSIRGRVKDATKDWPEQIVSIEYVPKSGKNRGSSTRLYYKDSDRNFVMWLKDTVVKESDGALSKTDNLANLWTDIQYNNLTREGNTQFANGKKPEKILFNVISLTTEPGDIVLDFHLGSGTTAAVAQKMGRKYIGIEQMDYIEEVAVGRLKQVLAGEQGGISSVVNWQGGGSFVYCELMSANQSFIDKISKAKSTKDLLPIWNDMKSSALLSYQVKPQEFDKNIDDFEKLSFEDQQRLLISSLDKNMLYVPLSEIDDKTYEVSDADKKINKNFFQVSR